MKILYDIWCYYSVIFILNCDNYYNNNKNNSNDDSNHNNNNSDSDKDNDGDMKCIDREVIIKFN